MPSAHPWLATIVESAHARALAERLERAGAAADASGGVVADGSRGSSTALLAGAVAVQTGRPILLVVAHLDEADDAAEDLALLDAAGYPVTAQRFGALEVLPGESGVSLELLAERLGVVEALGKTGIPACHSAKLNRSTDRQECLSYGVIVAPIQALMQSVPRPEAAAEFTLSLERGGELPPGQLFDWLDRAGYTRNDAIDQPGDFAVRGGIVDLYPPAGRASDDNGNPVRIGPVRLDFFGDEIETLHRINPDTLGSTDPLRSISLIGARPAAIQDDNNACLIDLLPVETIPVLHEVMELSEQARGYYERLTDPRGIYAPKTIFAKLLNRPHVEVNQYSADTGAATRKRLGQSDADIAPVTLPLAPLPPFDTDAKSAVTELGELAADHDVTVLCHKPAEAKRLRELLTEHAPAAVDHITLEVGDLHRGFVWGADGMSDGGSRIADRQQNPSAIAHPTSPLVLVPHHELFHRYDTGKGSRNIRRITSTAIERAGTGDSTAGKLVSDIFLDIDPGDYVVHIDHGIALFAGIKTLRREGTSQEYLTLEFDASAKLHVPVTQIDLIQKYVGGFSGRPPLSKLGGKRWKKQKESVAEAVKDLAAELLRVQAARTVQPGIRYPADTNWQKEFEAEFPFDETEDQLAAIAAVKRDMASPQPMDRLICGDVGFGKTEVAIRAAFKAAEFGKQVAVLVPTTVLAEQHERSFRGRMADYPFTVDSLSRFKTGKQQKTTLERVAKGQIDILIGTHRILSNDVKFADLGMVIIDEEQRFGVEHKNKLLQFRMTADVLTLSATPIPRTLHMSMVGLRDISSLTTAPVDRRAIVTEVIPHSKERIKQALVRELNRDGQVFFVHNRVNNIESVADEIKQLVPDAKVIVGHGQMSPRLLEKIMLTFIRGDADILVSTTIIESGIDIPTANTMFINQANHFGLAELHQLRGRVGRWKHRAYCYLLLPEDKSITEVAAKRLKAIESYAMLGAGFKIAMRDLEIRGAGNLLGAEQSGHIAAVGYEMYCLLLEQATKRLKNEPIIDASKTHLELPFAGTLPKRYIKADKHRMSAYRRLTRVDALDDLDAVVRDLTDAYGKPPPPAQTFIDITEVRIAAAALAVDRLQLEGPDLIFTLRTIGQAAAKLQAVFSDAPGRLTVLDEKTLYWRPPARYIDEPATLLAVLRKLLVRPVRDTAAPSITETPHAPETTHR
ncbi:transcription-repair coupling factor [Phycisphaeraceae bacterium D3-23]